MRRGDLVIASAPGEFGKPRPALVVQSNFYDATSTLTVALITSTRIDAPGFRIAIEPTPENGLQVPSQIMLDKVYSLALTRIGQRIGAVDESTLARVNSALAVFLGITEGRRLP